MPAVDAERVVESVRLDKMGVKMGVALVADGVLVAISSTIISGVSISMF